MMHVAAGAIAYPTGRADWRATAAGETEANASAVRPWVMGRSWQVKPWVMGRRLAEEKAAPAAGRSGWTLRVGHVVRGGRWCLRGLSSRIRVRRAVVQ